MMINNGTYSLEVGMLQSFLAEKFNENTLVSNKYDATTHKRLKHYLQFPDIAGSNSLVELISVFEINIQGNPRQIQYLFSIQNNLDSIDLVQKGRMSEQELADLGDGIFSLKEYAYEYGWKLTYRLSDEDRYIIKMTPISLQNILPRNDIISMFNQAGYDYVDNYYIVYDEDMYSRKIPQKISSNGKRMRMSGLALNITDTGIGEHYVDILNDYPADELVRLLKTDTETKSLNIDLQKPILFERNENVWCIQYEGELKPTSSLANGQIDHLRGKYVAKGSRLQLMIYPSKKRLYVIDDIQLDAYYAITHSNDVPTNINVVFSSDDVTIDGLKSGKSYNLIGYITSFNYVPVNDVKIIKAEKIGNYTPKSMIVEIDVPVYNGEDFILPSKAKYGDLNFDGVLDDKDISIIDEYGTDISKYSSSQRVVMKHIEGHRTADYRDVTAIGADDIEDIENLKKFPEQYDEFGRYVFAPLPTEPKNALLYVGQVSNYIENLYKGQDEQIKINNIKSTFNGLNFNKNSFLVHSKFMDYLLDSAIHKYSEEERVKSVYDLIGNSLHFKGYSDDLRYIIHLMQKENDEPFCTGFADVHTLFLMKEGQ